MAIDTFVDSLRVPANKSGFDGNMFVPSLVYVVEGKLKKGEIR